MTINQATFAAGCFWGVEHAFRQVPGVVDAVSGYAGGHVPNPSYEDVCRGDTGHAESVQVSYNPERVSFQDLVEAFWKLHDPTTKNRQGPDVGEQYRSVIFYTTEEERQVAEASKRAQNASGVHRGSVVTEIVPLKTFYLADEYHQRYAEKHGGVACHI